MSLRPVQPVTAEHEHDWWRTPSGALECACGASYRPIPEPETEENQ